MSPPPSPRVASIAWGRMSVEGLGEGKDFKLWPGGGRAWDWGETGTRHTPGVLVGDCEELLANGATHVVLSKGMHERLEVADETLRWLEENGIEVERLETKAAVARYNELAVGGVAVAGLFHSTC